MRERKNGQVEEESKQPLGKDHSLSCNIETREKRLRNENKQVKDAASYRLRPSSRQRLTFPFSYYHSY